MEEHARHGSNFQVKEEVEDLDLICIPIASQLVKLYNV